MPNVSGYIVDEKETIQYGKASVTLYLQQDDYSTAAVTIPMMDYFYIQVADIEDETAIRSFLCEPPKKVKKNSDSSDSENDEPKPNKKTQLRFTMKSEFGSLKSVYGFHEENGNFLRVDTWSAFETRKLVNRLEKYRPNIKLFESGLSYLAKFNAKWGVSGCAYVETPYAVHKQIRGNIHTFSAESVHVIAGRPFFSPKVMYYDIECLAQNVDVFPTADTCPIIQISYVMCMPGAQEPVERGVLCVNETPGYTSFKDEKDMLEAFIRMVNKHDPDVLCGYNSNSFDMPYIIDRMDVSHIEPMFSRQSLSRVSYTKERRASVQMGARWFYKFNMPGRILMDVCEILRAGASTKLASYTLKNVCAEYLGELSKDDVKYREIPELMKTDAGRAKIAKYCLQDSVLVYELDRKLMIGLNTWTLTRALGTNPSDTMNRGLVFKLMTKLKQYTLRHGFLIPSLLDHQRPTFEKYPGALVLEPVIGMYADPVVVLDFESLYPSEIRSANLSYDTLVTDKEWMASNPDKFVMQIGVDERGEPATTGHAFVKKSVRVGLLALMEDELGIERATAKKKMKEYPVGSRDRFVYDGLQQAAKIVMNSLYGMLGSSTAMIPMVEVAATITALGRKHLMWSKTYVEQHYLALTNMQDKPERQAKIIYGDTDSIFIHMPGVSVEEAIQNGRLLEKSIRENLYSTLQPMNMCYEKVFCPFIITRKKGYSGKMLKSGETNWRVATTGFANVKRDTAKIGVDLLNGFLTRILIEENVEAAKQMVTSTISDLFQGKLEAVNFKLTKKISKHLDDYKVVPPHIKAWQQMRARIGHEAPVVGEMFDFVVIRDEFIQGCKYIDYPLFLEKYTIFDLNVDYYFDHAIVSPLQEPLAAIYGRDVSKFMLDKKSYDVTHRVGHRPGNLVSTDQSALVTNIRARPPTSGKFHHIPLGQTVTCQQPLVKPPQFENARLSDMFVQIKKRKL